MCDTFFYFDWSVRDTQKSIHKMRRHNAAYYRLCEAPKKKS